MAAPLSLDNSRLSADTLTAALAVSKETPARDSDLQRALEDLGSTLRTVPFASDAFLNQLTDYARELIQADSSLVALRQGESIVCLARSGPLGPALGTPMDSRSGISGECLRQAVPLTCTDSQTDSRVDAEACLRLGIRSVLAVPVVERFEVVGLLEAFSSKAQAFGDSHVAILQKLASLVAESRSLMGEKQSPAPQDNAAVPLPPNLEPQVVSPQPIGKKRSSQRIEAFRLRPYQIAVVVGLLLLDLATLYWWQR
jgi:GAF domain